jgi:nicotinate phosphoribosyltransferase
LQQLLGKQTVFLIDTYNTLEGARLAARIGPPAWGVRLDSGDLFVTSHRVRRILDDAGCNALKIFATNDLNEHRIAELVSSGAPVDGFGVGTELATSADAPALSAVYKLVEIQRGDDIQGAAKFSSDKVTLPAAKQVYRTPSYDLIAPYRVCDIDLDGEPLLRPVLLGAQLTEPLPATAAIRENAAKRIAALPDRLRSLDHAEPFEVRIDSRLVEMAENLRRELQFTGQR